MLVFLDVETTHLSPGQVAQLSYIVADEDFAIRNAKNFYFAVKTMSQKSSEVNGLNKRKLAKLSGGLTFMDHIQEIAQDLTDHALICHNADFDLRFLQSEFSDAGKRLTPMTLLCTMRAYTPICKLRGGRNGSKYKWPKLQEVLAHTGIVDSEVADLASQAFKCAATEVHDSRFDTAAIYLICKKAVGKERMAKWVADSVAKQTEVAAAKQASEPKPEHAGARHVPAATNKKASAGRGCSSTIVMLALALAALLWLM